MNKWPKLNDCGKHRVRNLRIILDWLASGGDLKHDKHTLAMTEDGKIGFKVTHNINLVDQEFILQCDSALIWEALLKEADSMPDVTHKMMGINLTLKQK